MQEVKVCEEHLVKRPAAQNIKHNAEQHIFSTNKLRPQSIEVFKMQRALNKALYGSCRRVSGISQ
jgi:hypothetical protein